MTLPAGVTWVTNIKGVKGDTGTFAFFTAESIPADQEASAVMVGPPENRGVHVKVPRGLPGANAVENDAAFATYVAAVDSDTRAALAARFAPVFTPEAFGAVGDGVADDSTAVIAALNEAGLVGGTCLLKAGATYRVTESLVVPDGVTVSGFGAMIVDEATDLTRPVVDMGNNAHIDGPTISLSASSPGDILNGGARAHVLFGDYLTGAGVSGGSATNLTLIGGWPNCNGVFITGESSNITVRRINVPDSGVIGRPVMVHWGGWNDHNQVTGHQPGTYTKHPHGIIIDDISVGRMTVGNTGGAAVYLSSVYDISVSNVRVESAMGGVFVVPGDYGMHYADPIVEARGMSGITVDGVTIHEVRAGGNGFVANGVPAYAAPTVKPHVSFRDCSASGGLRSWNIIQAHADVTNCVAEKATGHTVEIGAGGSAYIYATKVRDGGGYGVLAGGDASDVHVIHSRVEDCARSGIAALGTAALPAKHIRVESSVVRGNGGLAGSAHQQAEIGLMHAHFVTVQDSEIGEQSPAARFGIYQATGAVFTRAKDNTFRGSLESQIYLTAGFDAETDNSGNWHTGPGVSVTGTTARTPSVGGMKVIRRQSPPPDGTWAQGDICIKPLPDAGAAPGWMCVTSGTPGVWRAFPALASV